MTGDAVSSSVAAPSRVFCGDPLHNHELAKIPGILLEDANLLDNPRGLGLGLEINSGEKQTERGNLTGWWRIYGRESSNKRSAKSPPISTERTFFCLRLGCGDCVKAAISIARLICSDTTDSIFDADISAYSVMVSGMSYGTPYNTYMLGGPAMPSLSPYTIASGASAGFTIQQPVISPPAATFPNQPIIHSQVLTIEPSMCDTYFKMLSATAYWS